MQGQLLLYSQLIVKSNYANVWIGWTDTLGNIGILYKVSKPIFKQF